MVVITARGNTVRSMLKKIRDELINNQMQLADYDNSTVNAKDEMAQLQMDILDV